MPAEQIAHGSHDQQQGGQAEPVVLGRPCQQQRIAALVDTEAGRRDGEETQGAAVQRGAMAAEGQPMVPGKGNAESANPTQPIGQQGRPLPQRDQAHDHQPVHAGSDAAGGDEPDEAGSRGGRGAAHGEPEHSLTLCLCADDFGLHAGINQAALRLVELGRVHALSCQVGGPAWPAGAVELRHLLEDAPDLGLHLDLSEHALGLRAQPLVRLVLLSQVRALDMTALRDEIEAQLDAFEQELGRRPDFVDGHQHVHQLPQVREALLTVLARRYPGRRLWLRSTRRGAGGFKPWLIEQLGTRALARGARRQGLPQNGRLLGVYDFQGGPMHYQALLEGWLNGARPGDLLMCHPSLTSAAQDSIASARRAEYAVLGGQAFGALQARLGLVLRPMSRILAGC